MNVNSYQMLLHDNLGDLIQSNDFHDFLSFTFRFRIQFLLDLSKLNSLELNSFSSCQGKSIPYKLHSLNSSSSSSAHQQEYLSISSHLGAVKWGSFFLLSVLQTPPLCAHHRTAPPSWTQYLSLLDSGPLTGPLSQHGPLFHNIE